MKTRTATGALTGAIVAGALARKVLLARKVPQDHLARLDYLVHKVRLVLREHKGLWDPWDR
jgi:hypothetical protein